MNSNGFLIEFPIQIAFLFIDYKHKNNCIFLSLFLCVHRPFVSFTVFYPSVTQTWCAWQSLHLYISHKQQLVPVMIDNRSLFLCCVSPLQIDILFLMFHNECHKKMNDNNYELWYVHTKDRKIGWRQCPGKWTVKTKRLIWMMMWVNAESESSDGQWNGGNKQDTTEQNAVIKVHKPAFNNAQYANDVNLCEGIECGQFKTNFRNPFCRHWRLPVMYQILICTQRSFE